MTSVTFLHIFLFAFSYITLNNIIKHPLIKNDNTFNHVNDNIYQIIPKTEYSGPHDIVRIIFACAPLIYLLKMSNTSKPLEHLTVLMSFILCIKSFKKLSNSSNDHNISFSFVIASSIALVYWKIIPYTDVNIIYVYIALFAIFDLSRRNIHSSQIINDLILVHSVFYISK